MNARVFTHGAPNDSAACGRPLHERRHPTDPAARAIWVCPIHGVVTGSVWTFLVDRIDGTLADRRQRERRRAERRGRASLVEYVLRTCRCEPCLEYAREQDARRRERDEHSSMDERG